MIEMVAPGFRVPRIGTAPRKGCQGIKTVQSTKSSVSPPTISCSNSLAQVTRNFFPRISSFINCAGCRTAALKLEMWSRGGMELAWGV